MIVGIKDNSGNVKIPSTGMSVNIHHSEESFHPYKVHIDYGYDRGMMQDYVDFDNKDDMDEFLKDLLGDYRIINIENGKYNKEGV